MNPNTFTVASLRQSFNHTRDIFGLLNSDVVKMQNTGQGRIYVDYCLGSLRGACLLVFNGTLVKTHSFLGRAEAFPLNLQHVVEALLARILPPFLELEMLLVQIYEVEKSIIASAAMMSPNPWTVLEPTDALLQGLIHQAMAKLGAFIPCVSVDMFAF